MKTIITLLTMLCLFITININAQTTIILNPSDYQSDGILQNDTLIYSNSTGSGFILESYYIKVGLIDTLLFTFTVKTNIDTWEIDFNDAHNYKSNIIKLSGNDTTVTFSILLDRNTWTNYGDSIQLLIMGDKYTKTNVYASIYDIGFKIDSFIPDTIHTDTIISGINIINKMESNKLIKVYNILGQETETIMPGFIYFYLYNDGTVKKKYITK